MTLEEQIARIVAIDCLTPVERAAMILKLPEMLAWKIHFAIIDSVASKQTGDSHGCTTA